MRKLATLALTPLMAAAALGDGPTTTPTTSPATAPATSPTTGPSAFTIGLDGQLGGTFVAGPAPATVHVCALGLTADWLPERYAWDFGDDGRTELAADPRTGQTIDLNSALTGPVAGYVYDRPGTYAVTLRRTTADGQPLTYTATVVVDPPSRIVLYVAPDGDDANAGTDPAKPLRTPRAAVAKLADHREVRFQRGGVYDIPGEFPLKHADLVLDCYGDAALPPPTLRRLNPPVSPRPPSTRPAAPIPAYDCDLFTTWPGQTRDVTVRHLRVDAEYAVVTSPAGYVSHDPEAQFGILRGRNVTVADVDLVNVLQGPQGTNVLAGGMFLRVRQTDPLGVPSRTLWLEGSDVVAVGNVALNSRDESPVRAASTGVVRGLIAFNDVAQQLDPAHGRGGTKAAVTLRTMADVCVTGNRVTGAEFSFDPLTADHVVERVVSDGNLVRGSVLHVKTNVRHAVFRDNTVSRDQGPCVTVSAGTDPAMWIDDVTVVGTRASGFAVNGRLLQIDGCGPAALRHFTYDPASNVYTHLPAPAGGPPLNKRDVSRRDHRSESRSRVQRVPRRSGRFRI